MINRRQGLFGAIALAMGASLRGFYQPEQEESPWIFFKGVELKQLNIDLPVHGLSGATFTFIGTSGVHYD